MIVEYEKKYMTIDRFNEFIVNNTTQSDGSLGQLMFDAYLKSKGFISKGIRNAYHPESHFFNPKTKEYIGIHFGIKYKKQERLFYISIGNNNYEVPSTQEEVSMFEQGKLKILFS